ncbi:hypothetical protein RA280_19860 [Cupriavidus sp. CV2]|uniref:hypothetical protein n=1 Tax=Cupriavidus ulmosensis TaxID=3065913 RepID=UPI00296A97EB|nr:hypothetical protein [Cupriavidus sp. CV2]MDW3683960.1 hypothetical protein [Cupriavidus sp. CV2]
MYQIDNSSAAASQPASTALGAPGFFTDGNPATGNPATIVPAEWLNAVMMEMANVVTGAGLTLTKSAYNQVLAAIKAIGKQSVILTDAGAVNAYSAVNPTPLVAGTLLHGVRQSVQIINANTGASTYAPDGLAAKPIYGLNLTALQGGELPAGGVANMIYVVNAAINSGNGAWILLECTGGALQVAPAVQPQQAAQLGQVGHGQCRLSVVSGTSLKLAPYNGNNLIINGVPQQIPGAGVTISNTGLAASALYYVYAYMNSGVMTLELSATGHSTGTNGVEIKTGDATRTLVGMIFTNASSQFQANFSFAGCANWFNRRNVYVAVNTSGVNFSNTSTAELSSGLRLTFLAWADEAVFGSLTGSVSNGTTGTQTVTAAYVNGLQFGGISAFAVAGAAPSPVPTASAGMGNCPEGANVGSVYGYVSAGTSTLNVNAFMGFVTRI